MSKHSDFKRVERDFYKTPESAVLPLLPYIQGEGIIFAEPCAGDGQLRDILAKHGIRCGWESDIEPQRDGIQKCDAREIFGLGATVDAIITNPPWEKRKWKGEIFNKLLRHWLATFDGDIWLLFDADWLHTVQSKEFTPYCKRAVSVGRVKWFPGTKHESKESCAWYCFNKNHQSAGYVPLYSRQGK